jgi:cytochrome c
LEDYMGNRVVVRKLVLWSACVLCAACGSGGNGGDTGAAGAERGELSAAELERGIGPVENVELGDIDPSLVARGSEIFAMKCAACHQLDDRYVGPPLREVTTRRTPEFIMNMMLNPAEMLERHPTVRQMLAEYYIPMPSQDLTREEARALLEYLRDAHASGERDPNETGAVR